MPVFKNKTHGRYVNIYKGILENKSLSIRDRGMLVTLLSFPDSWDFNIAGLAAILPDGKSANRCKHRQADKNGLSDKRTGTDEAGQVWDERH